MTTDHAHASDACLGRSFVHLYFSSVFPLTLTLVLTPFHPIFCTCIVKARARWRQGTYRYGDERLVPGAHGGPGPLESRIVRRKVRHVVVVFFAVIVAAAVAGA